MLRYALLLIVTLVSSQTVSAAIVRIADGDCASLNTAIVAAANAQSTTTIVLARSGNYVSNNTSGCGFANQQGGSLTIDGAGATIASNYSCNFGITFDVGTGASLTLRNMILISVPDNSCLGVGPTDTIANFGNLSLESVTLENVKIGNSDGATTILRNVTWIGGQGFGPFSIFNSTLGAVQLVDEGGSLVLANSLLAKQVDGFSVGGVCPIPGGANPESLVSLGGNLSDDSGCNLKAPKDHFVSDLGLGTFDNHGGLIPTQAIAFGSPASGVGVPQYCEAVDARGYTRAANGCDAGAYEYGGGAGALTANGMNGIYDDPDADGHYVSIQRIHDNGDIAILWSTFDQKGNQAWVYGVGQLSGQHIHAAMSQNVGGVLQVGGAPTGSSVRAWGTVDIDLTSCLLAQFNYQSSVANFGSGQFPLTRLALVSDFGCSN